MKTYLSAFFVSLLGTAFPAGSAFIASNALFRWICIILAVANACWLAYWTWRICQAAKSEYSGRTPNE